MELGYREEADDFINWLLYATRLTQPELRIMYDIFGEIAPRERDLSYLSGYCGSRPVRTGNGARNQLQLDVYGEVIDAAAQYAFHGGELDRVMQRTLIEFGKYVAANWNKPDEGIWEPRTGRQNHTHSRLLCWTALDRLITLAQRGSIRDGPLDLFKTHWIAIRQQLENRAWNERLQSYVSTLDGDEVDASLLLLSWYGFEKADSPRMRGTYRKLRESLGAGDALIYRYHTEPPEGAFAICSFWEVEYLAMGGAPLEDSHRLFRRLLDYQNDLGLYAEEIDPHTGTALGNFPQAFTHVGLIGAALSIQQREMGEKQLPHRAEDAASQPAEVSA
jgi:GH15 family glucan-1,4-alpha-glucosidase